jgi:thiol-disulfide isomerase/thioredoxin
MRAISRLLCITALAGAASSARAETWKATDGQSIEGSLSGIFGSVAIISGPSGTGVITLARLDDASLGRIADYMDSAPKGQPAWSSSTGNVAKGLRNRLQVLQGDKLVAFDPGARPEPEIYLVYFGAHWCHPCREFSPTLLERYRKLKEEAPDRFELVFVSNDRSPAEQLEYVRGLPMPWPVLKYSKIGSVPAVEHSAGPAIPDLVVLTRNGDVIFSSFHGAEYVGPGSVLDGVEPLLSAMDDSSPSCRWALHRLSVLRFVRSAAGATKGPAPYMVGLDPSHYRTLQTRKLTAVLQIDDHGRVTDAKVDPQLPAALEFVFEQDAQKWLFLPLVSNGQAKATKARLPISF